MVGRYRRASRALPRSASQPLLGALLPGGPLPTAPLPAHPAPTRRHARFPGPLAAPGRHARGGQVLSGRRFARLCLAGQARGCAELYRLRGLFSPLPRRLRALLLPAEGGCSWGRTGLCWRSCARVGRSGGGAGARLGHGGGSGGTFCRLLLPVAL